MTTLSFGKYKGQTLEQVIERDRNYVEWMAREISNPTIRKAAAELLATTEDKGYFTKQYPEHRNPPNCPPGFWPNKHCTCDECVETLYQAQAAAEALAASDAAAVVALTQELETLVPATLKGRQRLIKMALDNFQELTQAETGLPDMELDEAHSFIVRKLHNTLGRI